MKKIYFLFSVLGLAITSFAQTDAEKGTDNKTITVTSPVTAVILNNGVNLALLNDVTDNIFIEGKRESVAAVTLSFEAGVLTLSSSLKLDGQTVAVFISARSLKKITINGSSVVESYETLHNKGFDVLVNGPCKLVIRTFGYVNVSATEDFSYTYQSKALIK